MQFVEIGLGVSWDAAAVTIPINANAPTASALPKTLASRLRITIRCSFAALPISD